MTTADGADEAVDELYGVPPEEFTALRTRLAAAAKKSGDTEAAKRIGAARRPTTAAWVVNVIVRADDTARRRLAELAEELREAHAAMDGPRIRALSARQRKLIDELVRLGLAATDQTTPSAALRDDVVGTLAAAIADPDVAARLGTLAKAERWSGFGDFGAVTAVTTMKKAPTKKAPTKKASTEKSAPPADAPDEPDTAAIEEARRRRALASDAVDDAEAAHRQAGEAVVDARGKVATARRRYEKLLETLSAAEVEVETAEAAVDEAQESANGAADRLATTKDELKKADRVLGELE